AGGRVAAAMLQLGRAGPDGCLTVDIPLTHREIGELVGVSRETVTRALRELRQASAVRWTEDGLLILDPARLEGWQRGGGGA
ncbi:MAG TPA: helix-turn-helix domain-containing protein, partial [Bacillota bacterium]|nr:helix-turn-helix domain-containing protein [Bacillota bacterium]